MALKKTLMLRKTNQSGFITMIVIIVALLVLAIGLAFLRVMNTNK